MPVDPSALVKVASFTWDARPCVVRRRSVRIPRLSVAVLRASRISEWQPVAKFRPPAWRQFTSRIALAHRLVRDGFHALNVLSSGHIIAAVPGAIITRRPNQPHFEITHKILRGTRPLHIASTPDGTLYWGEYFDNRDRSEVFIYGSSDQGATWSVAYTFPAKAIRHVHNIVHDPWQNCLWILTGDYEHECRILQATCDLRTVEPVLEGNQQTRAVALIPTPDALYFSSDTPLEKNFIYRLSRSGELAKVRHDQRILNIRMRRRLDACFSPPWSNQVHRTRAGKCAFIEATTVGTGNNASHGKRTPGRCAISSMAMRSCRMESITAHLLAVTTIALRGADQQMGLWRVNSSQPG